MPLNKSVLISGLFLAVGVVLSVIVLIDMAHQATPPRQSTGSSTVGASAASSANQSPVVRQLSPELSPTWTPEPTPTPLPPTETPTAEPSPTQVSKALPATPTTPAATSTPTPTGTPSPTATPVPSIAHSPTLTPTSIPLPTLTATPTLLPTRTPTLPPSPTWTPSPIPPGHIQGRLLVDGVPVAAGVILKLEDQRYTIVGQGQTDAAGLFTFANLPASDDGYNVLFAQEWNTRYDLEKVVSWGWLGPVIVAGGETVQLPDLDISLQGFKQLSPVPDAAFSAAALSPEHPITFEWTAYPGAVSYWADLSPGEALEAIWQSELTPGFTATFDGTVEPGTYWWGVGARRSSGPYTLTVYGYQQRLVIEP